MKKSKPNLIEEFAGADPPNAIPPSIDIPSRSVDDAILLVELARLRLGLFKAYERIQKLEDRVKKEKS